MVAQRNYLYQLQRLNKTTLEIMRLASTIMGLPGQRSRHWEKLILEQRIKNKNCEISEQRRRWVVTSIKAERMIPETSRRITEESRRRKATIFW